MNQTLHFNRRSYFMIYIVLYRYMTRTGSRLIMKLDLFPISIMENVSPLMQKMM